MKILVVDDEQDICEILQYNLENEGYEVTVAYSAEEALEKIGDSPSALPDLILLDVMMGEMSGFQMARRLKDDPELCHIPIIFSTALDNEDDTVKGLNIGADDYIAKPLSIREVKARVKAVLRRSTGTRNLGNSGFQEHQNPKTQTSVNPETQKSKNQETLTYKSISVNLQAKVATLEGQPLQLTKLELELLILFLSNPCKVFSRTELLERCWPSDTYVLDRTVDVNITRLRKKIGQYGQQIKTRFGYGYCFE